MTTPDVPAGRDDLRERLLAIIESRRMEPWTDKGRPCCVMCGSRWDGEHKAECWVPTLREAAALLAPQTPDGYVVIVGPHRYPYWADRWGDDAKRDAEEHVEQLRAGGYKGAVIQEVYLGAPAPTEASDALRSAIEAMGDLHRALLHMGRGRLRASES